MHKTHSPATQGKITYVELPDGTVDVWIRNNECEIPESEVGPEERFGGFEADEIYFKLSSAELASREEIEADINDRDYRDMTREISPLRKAEDAVLVDSSEMSIEGVKEAIIRLYRESRK